MSCISVSGPWKEGIVLDYHVSSSSPSGYNEYGHMNFDTVRTELGELVYKIKYKDYDLNNNSFIELIRDELDKFLLDKGINYIIGVPPSNVKRRFQIVEMIGEAFSEYLEIPFMKGFLYKTDSRYVKNLSIDERKGIIDSIVYDKDSPCSIIDEKSNILLIDDIYESGSTLNACTEKLLDLDCINNVYILALTKTK